MKFNLYTQLYKVAKLLQNLVRITPIVPIYNVKYY